MTYHFDPMNINELKSNVVAISCHDGRAIMIRDDARLAVSVTAEVVRRRDAILAKAEAVDQITNDEEQAQAIQAHVAVAGLLKEAEEGRRECKEPVIKFGRAIDAQAKAFSAPLEAMKERLAHMEREYVTMQETRARAQEALRVKGLEELDRLKHEELAKATTVEQVDEIQRQINDEVRALCVPLKPVRAEGQVVREDWEITVTDVFALARAYPVCVSIEPRLMEIRHLLNAGVKPPGIEARSVFNSTVRAKPQAEPLRIA